MCMYMHLCNITGSWRNENMDSREAILKDSNIESKIWSSNASVFLKLLNWLFKFFLKKYPSITSYSGNEIHFKLQILLVVKLWGMSSSVVITCIEATPFSSAVSTKVMVLSFILAGEAAQGRGVHRPGGIWVCAGEPLEPPGEPHFGEPTMG